MELKQKEESLVSWILIALKTIIPSRWIFIESIRVLCPPASHPSYLPASNSKIVKLNQALLTKDLKNQKNIRITLLCLFVIAISRTYQNPSISSHKSRIEENNYSNLFTLNSIHLITRAFDLNLEAIMKRAGLLFAGHLGHTTRPSFRSFEK